MSLPSVGDRYRVHYAGDEEGDFIKVIAVGDLIGQGWDEVEFEWEEDGDHEVMDAAEFLEWPQLTKVSP